MVLLLCELLSGKPESYTCTLVIISCCDILSAGYAGCSPSAFDTIFSCPNSKQCVASDNVCDGVFHCVDGADENRTLCLGWRCTSGYKCFNGYRCLHDYEVISLK